MPSPQPSLVTGDCSCRRGTEGSSELHCLYRPRETISYCCLKAPSVGAACYVATITDAALKCSNTEPVPPCILVLPMPVWTQGLVWMPYLLPAALICSHLPNSNICQRARLPTALLELRWHGPSRALCQLHVLSLLTT